MRGAVPRRDRRSRPRDRHELVLLGRRAPVRRVEGDPRRPAPRRARVHRRGRRRLLHDRAADVAPPRSPRPRARRRGARSKPGLDMELPQLDCYGAPLRELSKPARSTSRSSTGRCAACSRSRTRSACSSGRTSTKTRAGRAYARPADRALAREAAVKSLVLLRNEGDLLPLSADQRIAVIGPAADDERLLQGDYSYPAHTEIVQPRDRRRAAHRAGRRLRARARTTPSRSRRWPASARSRPNVTYAKGAGVRGTSTDGFARRGRRRARGRRRGLLRRRALGPHARLHERRVPRRERSRPPRRAATARGSGRGDGHADGRRGGERPRARAAVDRRARARARVRVGARRARRRRDRRRALRRRSRRRAGSRSRCRGASGTFPIHHDHRAGGGRSQIFGDYVDAPASPLYFFGAGLTYTTFEYDTLRVHEPAIDRRRRSSSTVERAQPRRTRAAPKSCSCSCGTRSRASRGPTASSPASPASRSSPRRSATVRFTVDPTQLAYYDEEMRLVIEPGAVRVMVGGLEQRRTHRPEPSARSRPTTGGPTVGRRHDLIVHRTWA